jgi:hypothetical protein
MVFWTSPNKKLQSKFNAISLDVFFKITNDDIDAWNIKHKLEVFTILLDLFNIQDIVNVIVNEYFITTVQEDTTFYFSHPICFTFDTIKYNIFETKDLVILDNFQVGHEQICQCQHCLFHYYMQKCAKYFNQMIQFECKNKKRKFHEEFCGDCCLEICYGCELSGSIYVYNNLQLQSKKGHLTNCSIQAFKGSYQTGCFILQWEFVINNR